jgi:hypothetical protein
MYEIIANPADYGIEALMEGIGHKPIAFAPAERAKWAHEIGIFSAKLYGLAEKAKYLQNLFTSKETIMATPASLKTFKVQMFEINDAIKKAFILADKLEAEIIKK